ncbi:LLM class flavin-dependent oxidoreductase [Actinotalea sp. AC32]|nr:LLM class flavin-dependent oxidoreductase [Actinotalea sp. AC32]
MPDLGHDLIFGSFLTPRSADPGAVVGLARLSEEVGLDLVTFQDHPYQPAFLDTWTLLSWVAASTERIHVAGNVLNLPLRQPAVLARSVASLDLLSGGRVALGIGAGAFSEAVEAMGGQRLTPGQGVTALEEALSIIRGIWDVDAPGSLRVDGTHHHVRGAKRGPAPAHDVPVWVGAYKPRMLGLVGRAADGWLPSLGYIQPHEVAAANRVIDDAAHEAGRRPADVRRMLNVMGGDLRPGSGPSTGAGLEGNPADWVEELLPLAVDDGVSAFVLGSDDPTTLRVFAEEVAPALREAVAAERGPAHDARRAPRALELRTPGLDYDSVPASLAARAVEPGDREYARVRSTYVWQGSPAIVLRPTDAVQVADALAYARSQDVPLSIRSGGHGISGRSTNDGGVVVDLGALDHVEVLDRARRLVRVGAGARWGDVAEALRPHGLAISSGDYGDVGVGGLVTAGGIGLLARSYGLTVDHVVGAEAVLTDGQVVRVDAENHPDLFWALRGAGGNMAVVTSVDVEAAELGDVVLAVVVQDVSATATFLRDWGALVEASPRELTPFLTIFRDGDDGPPVAQALHVWAGDDVEPAVRAIEPFLALAPVLQQRAQLVPYAAVVAAHHGRHAGQAAMRSRSAFLDHLDATTAEAVASIVRDPDQRMVQVRSVGGAVNDVPADATAYAHRHQQFCVSAVQPRGRRTAADAVWDRLAANGSYLSFESDDWADALPRVFPGATLERLRQVKAEYDPDELLRLNVPIPPAR